MQFTDLPIHHNLLKALEIKGLDTPTEIQSKAIPYGLMGKDLIAFRIREIAQENEVEIFEAPPLARALYAQSELKKEIPGQLFFAVAQVLAFVFQLRTARQQGLVMPQRPDPYMSPEESPEEDN